MAAKKKSYSVIIIYSIAALCWIALHAYILYSFGFNWQIAVVDSKLNNVLIGIAAYIMFNTLRFYQPSQKNLVYLFEWSIILSVAIIFIFRWIMRWIFISNDEYMQFLQHTILLRFAFVLLMVSCVNLLIWLWYNFKTQKKSDARKTEAEKLAREAELFNLRQQLQPHFLFNSLNSISALAGSQPEQARKMIQQLSDFLRGTLKKDEQQFSTLEKELLHLGLYLEIEKVRFGHRLKTEIITDEQTNKMQLPSLLLQPIVENAIKFGLYDSVGEVLIRIKISAEENYLKIEIQNPFDTVTVTAQKGTGFGLSSVQRRLFLLFSRNDLLKTESIENIFSTTIKIPQL